MAAPTPRRLPAATPDHLAAELQLRSGRTVVPLEPGCEHAVLALGPGLTIGGRPVGQGRLGYLGTGRDEVAIDAADSARALLLGSPFPEQLLMWWNYVARTRPGGPRRPRGLEPAASNGRLAPFAEGDGGMRSVLER